MDLGSPIMNMPACMQAPILLCIPPPPVPGGGGGVAPDDDWFEFEE